MLSRVPVRIGTVIIGVNNGLRLAENDAEDHWALLNSGAGPFRGDGARLLLGAAATVRAVDEALRDLARHHADVAIVIFAGHANERGILLSGARLYPYPTLLARLRETGAGRQLVILDACRAGAFAELARTKVGGLGGIEYLTQPAWLDAVRRWPRGLRVVASARSNESAHESRSPNARNSFFTASFVEHAQTLSADLAGGFVSDVAIVDRVTQDLSARGLPQTPLVWGGRSPIPVVRSEHDVALGRAVVSSVQTLGTELVVNVGTVGRRFLPTQVHVSVHSHVTGAVATCNRVFVPAASLAVEPVRIDARTILLDDWHRSLARDGYTIEWVVSVADRCGRLLTHWDNVVRYQAA